ncbi:MAG: DUF2156 domain-containing protein, partial [Oligoflexia bacterium]|nr:DUF2156 domain-containing protein [Oligoflexia bacterium]
CCFFGTESRFDCGDTFSSLLLGEQPVWDPTFWADTVGNSGSLREQLRRARAKGVGVRRISAADAVGSMRPAIQALRDRWLGTRKMAAMGFVVRPQLFALAPERRFYVAQRDGKLCGVLVAVPVYARNGWFFEHLLRDDDAPNGTTDALVDLAMRDVAADGARYATLGLAPLSGGVNRWLKLAARLGSPLYSFNGVRAFKQRLRPDRWEPIYLSYPSRHHGFMVMLDVLRAFANGSLLRFGLRTLRQKIRHLSPA